MKSIFKSKRGDVFLPALVIVLLVVLISLAFAIKQNNDKIAEELPIGTQALALARLNNEIQNAEFYVEISSIYTANTTLKTIADNGGYPAENKCQKTDKPLTEPQYIIFSSECGDFNPEESYKAEFQKNLNFYLINYQSYYDLNTLNDPTITKTIYNYIAGRYPPDSSLKTIYLNKINALEIKEHKFSENQQLITFKPIKYLIEFSAEDSYYEHAMKLKLEKPNLNSYQKIYNSLVLCKTKKENPIQECIAAIKTEFPSAIIIEAGNLLKINTNSAYPDMPIKLAFNISKELPPNKITSFEKE